MFLIAAFTVCGK